MPRTNIPVSELNPNAHTDDPAGTAGDAANGHVVTGAPLEEIVLRVVNGAVACQVTVQSGKNPPALEAGQGDLVRTVGADTTEFLGPFTSGRFWQDADGDDAEGLWFDLDDASNVTITAFHLPRTA